MTLTRAATNQLAMRAIDRLRHGPMRFSALDRAMNSPHPVATSSVLKKLERDGLITRTVIRTGPPAHVEYALTPLGHDFSRPAGAVLNWLEHHADEIAQARRRSRGLKEIASAEGLLADRSDPNEPAA